MFDWNDLKHFLAVADTGSSAAAARAIGTSQPTVVRRVAALEECLRLPLFDRHNNGYRLTPHGTALLPLARRVAAEVEGMEAQVRARARTGDSVIRLTMPEASVGALAPMMARFRDRFPGTRLELRADDVWLDLLKGEADVAVRAGYGIDTEGLVGTCLSDVGWAMYASPAYLDSRGLPQGFDDLRNHAIIGAEGKLAASPPFQWLDRLVGDAPVVWRGNVVSALVSAARAGLGIAALPCAVGSREPGLEPATHILPGLQGEMWVLTRPELRLDPAIKHLMELILDFARDGANNLSGRNIRLRGEDAEA